MRVDTGTELYKQRLDCFNVFYHLLGNGYLRRVRVMNDFKFQTKTKKRARLENGIDARGCVNICRKKHGKKAMHLKKMHL